MQQQDLIPGLPDDISREIIARIPHHSLPSSRPVSRPWLNFISSPSFLSHRKSINSSEDLVFLIQSLSSPSFPAKSNTNPNFSGEYALSIYNSTNNSWHRLSESIPMFAQIVATDRKIVVLGGWDVGTLEPTANVRVLDLITGEWTNGSRMLTKRSFFACAAVGTKVYVAGGHDSMKNALNTAEIYDVAGDDWAEIAAMAEGRDECKGVVLDGRFWAVSGYRTENQGRFLNSGEWYDEVEGVWGKEEGVWPEEGGAAACFAGGERMWRGSGSCAAEMGGGRVFVMAGGGGEVAGKEGGYGGWVVEKGRWRRVETPANFAGFAYSAAGVRI